MTAIDKVVAEILHHEGGLVEHPLDPGGVTNFGITLPFLQRLRPEATADTIRHLTEAQAILAYTQWIEAHNLDMIKSWRVLRAVVDFAVHSGEKVAIRALQKAVGTFPDGILGSETVRLLESSDSDTVERTIWAERLDLWAAILKRKPTQSVFIRGWLHRAASLLR